MPGFNNPLGLRTLFCGSATFGSDNQFYGSQYLQLKYSDPHIRSSQAARSCPASSHFSGSADQPFSSKKKQLQFSSVGGLVVCLPGTNVCDRIFHWRPLLQPPPDLQLDTRHLRYQPTFNYPRFLPRSLPSSGHSQAPVQLRGFLYYPAG